MSDLGFVLCLVAGGLIGFLFATIYQNAGGSSELVIAAVIAVPILAIGIGIPLAVTLKKAREDEKEAVRRKAEFMNTLRTLADLSALEPRAFEGVVAEYFRELGYETQLTSAVGDGGIDIHLRKGAERCIAQCKRWQGNVGVTVVREFFGVMVDKQILRGFIVTTGHFTMAAKQFANGKGIQLIDGPELAQLLQYRTRRDTE